MDKPNAQLIADINAGIARMRQTVPDTLSGFNSMSRNAMKAGVLSDVHKELIALAIGVAGHCEGCIAFHARSLVRLGATREQIMETLAVAVYMGGGPSLMYAAEAANAYEEFLQQSPSGEQGAG